MADNYLDRLLSGDEIPKERVDFIEEDLSSFGCFMPYAVIAVCVIVLVLLVHDPSAETHFDRFHRECLEDKHTRTECEFMYDQMFK